MEDFVESLTRGNSTEVKVVLTSVIAAVAVYQAFLMAVGYEKIRLRFLGVGPASWSHRAIGYVIVAIGLVVSFFCLAVYGFEDDGGVHAIAGIAVFAVVAFKVGVVRRWQRLDPWLPVLGISILALFELIWATSAGDFLANGPHD